MAKPKSIPSRRLPLSATAATPVIYVESTALVAAILKGDAAAQASIRAAGQRVTSALTVAETGRAILRARIGEDHSSAGARRDDYAAAIHLATAQALGDPPALVTIVTRDVRVRDSATALGYLVE